MNTKVNRNTVSGLYPDKWVSAGDLRGQSVLVTVESISVENVRQANGGDEPRVILSFVGKQKRLICNKTQALALSKITGTDHFTDWRGATIMLVAGLASNGRQTIGIFPAPTPTFGGQPAQAPDPEPDPDPAIPF
jgi:hypothetical protein